MPRFPQNRAVPGLTFFVTTSLANRALLLRAPDKAQIVVDSLQFFRRNGDIELYGFVVMPDHVHLILKLHDSLTLPRWVRRFKSYTAHGVGLGPIWEKGYWSEVVAGESFLLEKLQYIHANPIRAGLVTEPQEYAWSSAHHMWSERPEEFVDSWRGSAVGDRGQ